MAKFKKGDKITLQRTEGFYLVVSVSVLTKGGTSGCFGKK